MDQLRNKLLPESCRILLLAVAFVSISFEVQADPFRDTERNRREAMVGSALNPRSAHTWDQSNYESDPLISRLEDDLATLPPDIQENSRQFHANVPMGGFSDVMNAGSYGLLYEQQLLSALSLQNVALNLTEPAVGAGTVAAIGMAGDWLSHRYRAEQDFFERLKSNPEQRQLILESYNECIATELNNNVGWVMAQDRCLPAVDRLVPRVGGFVAPSGPAPAAKGMNHPNFTGEGQENEINILNVIFPGHIGSDNAQVRTQFRQYFGYATLRFPISPSDLSHGRFESRLRKHPPSQSPRERYLSILETKYSHLIEALTDYCLYQANHPDGIQITSQAQSAMWSETNFARTSARRLALHGFQLVRPPVMDPLLDFYKSSGSTNCNISTVLPSGQGNVQEWQRSYLYFARKLAWGELLGRYMVAEERVMHTPGGSALQNAARQQALELIYEVAGTSDLAAAYEANTQSLRRAIAATFERYGERTRISIGAGRVGTFQKNFSLDR